RDLKAKTTSKRQPQPAVPPLQPETDQPGAAPFASAPRPKTPLVAPEPPSPKEPDLPSTEAHLENSYDPPGLSPRLIQSITIQSNPQPFHRFAIARSRRIAIGAQRHRRLI